MGIVLGILGAVLLHALILLFGGIFFMNEKEDKGTLQQVELLNSTDDEKEKEKPKEKPAEKKEELESEQEQAPDAAEVMRNLELSAVADAPALEAASLAAIEAALAGQSGVGGDFDQALSFSSGGRIGGTGKGSALDEKLDSAFSLSEIDQQPRVIFQAVPLYPSEMRGKKVEGLVTVIFIVDSAGKVINPKVEKSSHTAFEKPAVDAVKQWKFEPAIKGGKRVNCKMRAPIRFQPS